MKSPPATHTQHLKEIERGGDKKKQKKWKKNHQIAKNSILVWNSIKVIMKDL